MAARYWILGAGNWNDPLHWSATSGGVGGASVPTMNDDVYFDSNSGTGTITVNAIANMRDCTFAQTQLITLANAAYAFNIYGNWTLCSNTYLNTSFTGTGYVYLKATTSVNITSNGCTRTWNRLYFDGVGGEWLLQDEWNTGSSSFYFVGGHFKTENNNLSCSSLNTISHIGTKELSLGASVVTLTGTYGISFAHNGFSLNAGTSTINNYGIYIQIPNSTSITFYNLNQYTRCVLFSESTFNNLRFYITSVNTITTNSNFISLTVNDTLEINGIDSNKNRILLSSGANGMPITITCNGTVTASNVDFRDIVGAGTANWDLSAIEGGSGDCGGNSGITFTPAQTQYHRRPSAGGSNWSTPGLWFTESGDAGRVPLPQDDVVFDENSFPIGSNSVYVNVPRIGRSINMEAVNKPITMTLANSIECYGSYVLGENITLNGNFITSISGRGNYIINTFNKYMFAIALYAYNGNYTIQSDTQGFYIAVYNGALDYNGYNFTGGFLQGTNINFRDGIFTLNTNSTYILSLVDNISEFATFILNTTSSENNVQVRLGNSTYKTIKCQNGGTFTGNYHFTGNPTIVELIIDSGVKVRFTSGRTQTISKLTVIGTPEQPITIGSTTPGSKYTLNLTGTEPIETDYINITDCNATQTNKFYAGVNSINGGNNTNVIFDYAELPLNMNLYTLKIYDKVLTDDEVLQNYNATKSRYII